jgi:multidrug transporter EmrE-like cation transporter
MEKETITLLILVLFISLSECMGQSCLKKFHLNPLPNNNYLYYLAVLFYGIVCLLLLLSYRYKSMGLVNVLWSGISVLVVLSAGALFFHEKITFLDKLGVLFILLGIGCVVWEN